MTSADSGKPKRPIADQAGAQERRDLQISVLVGKPQAETLVRDRVLGVTTVRVVSGESGFVAQVFAAGAAVAAVAVGPAEPRNPDPPLISDGCRDDLVTEYERQFRARQLAVGDVQVGAANATRTDAHEQLARTGLRFRELSLAQRLPRPI